MGLFHPSSCHGNASSRRLATPTTKRTMQGVACRSLHIRIPSLLVSMMLGVWFLNPFTFPGCWKTVSSNNTLDKHTGAKDLLKPQEDYLCEDYRM